MIRTFDRYVFREVAWSWLAVTGVLLVILLSNQLARILGQAATNGFPREVVWSLIVLSSFTNLTVLVPVGMLLAIMLALGRLYHESEMAAVRACGVGPERLYLPISALAILVAVLAAWLGFVAAPGARAEAESIRRTALRDAQFGQLDAGKFRTFARGSAVFYAERVDSAGILYNVFLQRRVGDRLEVATAATAEHRIEQDGELHVLVLHDGVRYEGVPGRADFRRVRFGEHGIPVRVPDAVAAKADRSTRPTQALLGSPDPADAAELQWRMSQPAMVLVLTLLAVPLSALRPRQGRYARVAVGLLFYFIYSNLLSASRVWVEKGQLDPRIGMWWVHLAVVLAALWLLNRQSPLVAMWRERHA
ncbi:MAG: LPS export ABC transporter permease LptF [Steroidobacteraceae bacterium]|nr:LPS export ABC transporter permease LptF [Steroidobacteraceae bacterium]MCC7198035.1 LPS export ABC transporter permease LptF [Gammaproteobacteria bacterium]